MIVEIAQLLAQFRVSRLALVVEARLAVLISAALVLPACATSSATAASSSSVFASRKLRFHRRSDAAFLDRPLRIPPQFNQLFKKKESGCQSATVSVKIEANEDEYEEMIQKKEAIKWKEMDPSHVAIMWLMIENNKDPISKYSLFLSTHGNADETIHTEKEANKAVHNSAGVSQTG